MITKARYGTMMHLTDTFIGGSFLAYGEYSENEVSVLRVYLRPGDTVVDVGAFIGDLTLPMAQIVGRTGKVFAFEPDPLHFRILCANMALNEIENVEAIQAQARTADSVPLNGLGRLRRFAIDEMGLPNCRFIKVDTDGADRQVLLSGKDTITRCRPVLYVENDVLENSAELIETISELGYDAYWHLAPLFNPNNIRQNPTNIWGRNIISIMMLCLPRGGPFLPIGLPPVLGPQDQWCDLVPDANGNPPKRIWPIKRPI